MRLSLQSSITIHVTIHFGLRKNHLIPTTHFAGKPPSSVFHPRPPHHLRLSKLFPFWRNWKTAVAMSSRNSHQACDSSTGRSAKKLHSQNTFSIFRAVLFLRILVWMPIAQKVSKLLGRILSTWGIDLCNRQAPSTVDCAPLHAALSAQLFEAL